MIIQHKTIYEPPKTPFRFTFEAGDVGGVDGRAKTYIPNHSGCKEDILQAFKACLPPDLLLGRNINLNEDLDALSRKITKDVGAREFLFDCIKGKELQCKNDLYFYECLKKFAPIDLLSISSDDSKFIAPASLDVPSDVPASFVNSLRELLVALSGRLNFAREKSAVDSNINELINVQSEIFSVEQDGFVRFDSFCSSRVFDKEVETDGDGGGEGPDPSLLEGKGVSLPYLTRLIGENKSLSNLKGNDVEDKIKLQNYHFHDYLLWQPLGSIESLKSKNAKNMVLRFDRCSVGWSLEFAIKINAAAKGVLEEFSSASRGGSLNMKAFIKNLNKQPDVYTREVARIMKSGSGFLFGSAESSEKFQEKINALCVATQIKCENLKNSTQGRLSSKALAI